MRYGFLPVVLLLSACGDSAFFPARVAQPAPDVTADPARPQARPETLTNTAVRRPPVAARTAEEFDTTTAAQRAEAAAAPAPAAERALGTTVASLGDPARPGFWLETPLVDSPAKGRVFFPASGKSAQVDLIPIDGPKTAGSRISLAAMRLIEAPLTDLPTIEVFVGG